LPGLRGAYTMKALQAKWVSYSASGS
jgi:hypothetical protein